MISNVVRKKKGKQFRGPPCLGFFRSDISLSFKRFFQNYYLLRFEALYILACLRGIVAFGKSYKLLHVRSVTFPSFTV